MFILKQISFIESLFHGVSAASSMQNVKYLPKFLQPSNPVPDSRNPDSPKLFNVACTTSDNLIIQFTPVAFSKPFINSNTETPRPVPILNTSTFSFCVFFQDTTDSNHVGFSQVNNIDKVTDTRTVRCIIIITKHT